MEHEDASKKEPSENIMAPAFRRVHATLSNSEFTTFLQKAASDGWVEPRDYKRVDIGGCMDNLVMAYAKGLVVILDAHDVAEARKAMAKKVVTNGFPMGTEKPKGE